MNISTLGLQPEQQKSWSARLGAAEAASDAGEWEHAAELWGRLRRDFPDQALCWIKSGEAYREIGQLEQADQILREGVSRFPGDRWMARQYAMQAGLRGDWPEALRRAEILRAAHADFWPAWLESAYALAQLGRAAEADERRSEAAKRFPHEFWPNYWGAYAAAKRADSREVLRIWSDLAARFPDEEAARTAVLNTRKAAGTGSAAPRERQAGTSGAAAAGLVEPVAESEYRCPTDLAVSSMLPRRVLVIGSCVTGPWAEILQAKYPQCVADHILVNHAQVLPSSLPAPPEDYDFQLVQMPLQMLLPAHSHFRLSYSDPAAFERLFDEVCGRMSDVLADYMRWNRAHSISTFVCNFLVPQQNPMGRLLPRYDLRNFVHFIEKLNEALGQELQQYKNTYLFDLDQLASTYGRRHLQDDAVWTISHGSALSDWLWEDDHGRLEPIEKVTCYYPVQSHAFVLRAWAELLGMYRTIRQTDMVKLVLVDLDDTLWRGVAAEADEASSMAREGWPLGFAEALMFLKRRGILLGVVSKNDEDRVRAIWQRIYGNLIRLEDFAVTKINWRPKADNIEEILGEVNLLAKSVVFIDDNPVERAAVKAAFPDMRVLGPNPYLWRRILLWAPETQVATVTAESAARTEMVQKQVERETQRKRLSRDEFLASLEVRASVSEIASISDSRFARALELTNKTNQFNTTGKRWTQQEMAAFFRDGGRCFVLDVADRFTAYGIVGVLLIHGTDIVQFVMSCRVVGMDVEIAAVASVLRALAAHGTAHCSAALVHTSANLLCRDLWERCGFAAAGAEHYERAADPAVAVPGHIALRLDTADEPALSAAE